MPPSGAFRAARPPASAAAVTRTTRTRSMRRPTSATAAGERRRRQTPQPHAGAALAVTSRGHSAAVTTAGAVFCLLVTPPPLLIGLSLTSPSRFSNARPDCGRGSRVSRRGFPSLSRPSTTIAKPPCAARALCTRVTRSLCARAPRMRGAVGVCNARGLLVAASAARGVGGPWRGWSMSVSFTLRTREVTDKHRACPHSPRCTILIDQCQSGSLIPILGVCLAALVREATRHCGVTSNHAMSAVQDP